MKSKCLISHRAMLENGGYKDYMAGETYDLPSDHDIGPYFEPAGKELKKTKKEVMSDG